MSNSGSGYSRTKNEVSFQESRIEGVQSDDNDDAFEDVDTSDDDIALFQEHLPLWLRPETLQLFPEGLKTNTSDAKAKVVSDCLPLLLGEDESEQELNRFGMPRLRKNAHAAFLIQSLGRLPAGFVAMDASRPWIFYWCLNGLATLGQDVSTYRQTLIETVQPLQNASGGFGGGHGQYSHVACTYACTLALAITGGLDAIDRDAMWHFLGTMKQGDGGFTLAEHAEEDIRGAYCAMTVIALLNLPLELPPNAPARAAGIVTFVDRLSDWVGRCQTYEGGIAASPGNEAHGGYAFCALACLCLIDTPSSIIPSTLDLRSLISWLTSMQTSPEGGFAGRTNKLVDACYSQWVGGCWSLLTAALHPSGTPSGGEELWNREALIRYSLCCAQQPGVKRAGMRDKPSARADAYHTNYALAGLSAAQHVYLYDDSDDADHTIGMQLPAAFNWLAMKASSGEMQEWCVDESDLIGFVHPVFVIPMSAAQDARTQFRDNNVS